MRSTQKLRGIFVPALTPFAADLSVDKDRFVDHCRWLLDRGANGLAVLGTTSEANSLAKEERMQLLEELVASGVPGKALIPGTGCCALPDTVKLTKHAVNLDCLGVLLLPPFYYKGVSDEGIYAATAEVIERVADERLRIYLYHIPQMAGAGYSLPLIERLISAYPQTIVGIKDSSGDWENTQSLLREFPQFETFCGSEVFLLQALRLGGAGCITATGNANASGIAQLIGAWQSPEADSLQEGITKVRLAFQKHPVIPALKSILARVRSDPGWNILRPPLRPLSQGASDDLAQSLERLDFLAELSAAKAEHE
jgi:4-hydroxy-tetrahydrodipicolinate synthase